jgi:motility quorum-sensing regulator/GCU-specific mRNA interferase toxin
VEKRRPHHNLRAIKTALSTVAALRLTETATQCAERLGLTLRDVVGIIQGTTASQFYKSMTSAGDSTIWQDVYHVPHKASCSM